MWRLDSAHDAALLEPLRDMPPVVPALTTLGDVTEGGQLFLNVEAANGLNVSGDEAAVSAAKAWYAKVFGGVTGKRSRYDAVDLPGVNFNFSVGPKAVGPTRGRVLDHEWRSRDDAEDLVRQLERGTLDLGASR